MLNHDHTNYVLQWEPPSWPATGIISKDDPNKPTTLDSPGSGGGPLPPPAPVDRDPPDPGSACGARPGDLAVGGVLGTRGHCDLSSVTWQDVGAGAAGGEVAERSLIIVIGSTRSQLVGDKFKTINDATSTRGNFVQAL